jgi:hypothetical protein
VDANTNITITGISKYKVGQFAAEIRDWRKPEPYKARHPCPLLGAGAGCPAGAMEDEPVPGAGRPAGEKALTPPLAAACRARVSAMLAR